MASFRSKQKNQKGIAFIPFLIIIAAILMLATPIFKNFSSKTSQVPSPSSESSPTPISTPSLTPKPISKKTPSPKPTPSSSATINTSQTLPPSLFATSTPTPLPTVTTPTVRITYPNGGETFTEGNQVNITWEATGIFSSFVLAYSDCPSCAGTIASVNGFSRSYNWKVDVGNTSNTQFKIWIISYPTNYSPNPTDYSDSNFTVYQSP